MDFNKLRRNNQRNKFIFSNAAAERILGLPAFSVVETDLTHENKVLVKTRDKKYELPTSAFYQDFTQSRQRRSQKLQVSTTEYGNVFMITNPENHNRYPTRTIATGVECRCRDYEKQQELITGSRHCCKHGYAVLSYLGYSSLAEYLAANSLQATA